jgi:hypothetical protein
MFGAPWLARRFPRVLGAGEDVIKGDRRSRVWWLLRKTRGVCLGRQEETNSCKEKNIYLPLDAQKTKQDAKK